MSGVIGLSFGIFAESFAKQLRTKSPRIVKALSFYQADSEAISRLGIRGFLTEKETDRARLRVMRKILKDPDVRPLLLKRAKSPAPERPKEKKE